MKYVESGGELFVIFEAVPQSTLDYIQRVYDNLTPKYDDAYARGIEFVVLQLNLPIRIRH
jgi:hypothetical protein